MKVHRSQSAIPQSQINNEENSFRIFIYLSMYLCSSFIYAHNMELKARNPVKTLKSDSPEQDPEFLINLTGMLDYLFNFYFIFYTQPYFRFLPRTDCLEIINFQFMFPSICHDSQIFFSVCIVSFLYVLYYICEFCYFALLVYICD